MKTAVSIKPDCNIESLIDNITEKRAILILGPDIAVNNERKSCQELFLDYIHKEYQTNKKLSNYTISYHPKDELFLFEDETEKTEVSFCQSNFYKHEKYPEIFNKIIQIPFDIYLTMMPNGFLEKSFENAGCRYNSKYFNRKTKEEINVKLKKAPLIYNLFGHHSLENSLILSHKDMYEFLKAIFLDYLPFLIKKKINEARCFIFLGFQYHKWYYQLFLNILTDIKHSSNGIYSTNGKKPFGKEFCETEFNITFIDESSEKFVEQLYNACQNYKGHNILREIFNEKKIFEILRTTDNEQEIREILGLLKKLKKNKELQKELKQLLINNQIERVFTLLRIYFENNKDIYDEIVMLMARYNNIKNNYNMGLISNIELEQELNKIRMALLNIINRI